MDSNNSWPSDGFPILEPILPSVASSTRGFCSGNGLLDQLCTSTSEDSAAAFSPETLTSSHHDCASIKPSLPIICSTPFMQDGNFGDCDASEISNGLLAASRPKDENHESSGSVVSSESESSLKNGSNKKPKVEQAGTQPKTPITQNQVRKLGEKINALQQLVSPFGKTDTASVLSEAIGYIKFLQEQVHVLSSPYLASSANRKGCETKPDLRSRGLCLVPISCTANVANNNGADYWISGHSKRCK